MGEGRGVLNNKHLESLVLNNFHKHYMYKPKGIVARDTAIAMLITSLLGILHAIL